MKSKVELVNSYIFSSIVLPFLVYVSSNDNLMYISAHQEMVAFHLCPSSEDCLPVIAYLKK